MDVKAQLSTFDRDTEDVVARFPSNLSSRSLLDELALSSTQKHYVQQYIDNVLASETKRAVNAHIINFEKSKKFLIMPPYYKFIDTFTNSLKPYNNWSSPETQFSNLPFAWTMKNNTDQNDRFKIVNVQQKGVGDSTHIGRSILLKRLQLRFMPGRLGKVGIYNSNGSNQQFSPIYARLLVFYDPLGTGSYTQGDFTDFFQSSLNTTPSTITITGTPGQQMTQTSLVYAYTPIALHVLNRITLFVDKLICLPTMNNLFNADGTGYLIESPRYQTQGLKPIELDIPLNDLETVFQSNYNDILDATFGFPDNNKRKAPDSIIKTGRLVVGLFTSNPDERTWAMRGYTRVFYEDK